ncbi:DUF2568 domain-containing protein [Pediococcus siamensis]|uniref:DUF2568 domain-containing protein n=1 Tax=Pediococcus siamensis TaxID=381829 RepID=UPI00399FA952
MILPIIFSLVWSTFVAPASSRRANLLVRILIELVIFATVTLLVTNKVSSKLGIIYGLVVLGNTALVHLGDSKMDDIHE